MPNITLMIDPNKIIDGLGGTTAVAKMLDIKTPSVSGWRTAGIPKGRLKHFQAIRPDLFEFEQTAATTINKINQSVCAVCSFPHISGEFCE
jgi:hypothetical protein